MIHCKTSISLPPPKSQPSYLAGGGTSTESVDVRPVITTGTTSDAPTEAQNNAKSEPYPSDNEAASDTVKEKKSPKSAARDDGGGDNNNEDEEPSPNKQKQLSFLIADIVKDESSRAMAALSNRNNNSVVNTMAATLSTTAKTMATKSKKKNIVRVTKSKRSKKKNKGNNNNNHHHANGKDTMLITQVPRFSGKSDSTLEMKIYLLKVYKAEKVELNEKEDEEGDRNVTIVG